MTHSEIDRAMFLAHRDISSSLPPGQPTKIDANWRRTLVVILWSSSIAFSSVFAVSFLIGR